MRVLERIFGIGLGAAALLFGFRLGRDRSHQSRATGARDQVGIRGHETSDLSARAVTAFGVGLLLFLGLTFLIVTWMVTGSSGKPLDLGLPANGLDDQPSGTLPAEPRLETIPGRAMAELRAQQQAQLSEYRWLDRESGIVRIPIDQAMDALAERGLPLRREGSPYQDQGESLPSGASSGRVLERVGR